MQEADEQSEGIKKNKNNKKKPVRGAQVDSWSAAREGERALVWFILWMSVYSKLYVRCYTRLKDFVQLILVH